MNKEEIENYITELESMFELSELEEHSRNILKVGNYIKQLQQENKILRENAEHNDKVVDKVNWENLKLKEENKRLYNTIEELSQYKYDREEEDMMNYIIEQEEVFNDYSFMDEL